MIEKTFMNETLTQSEQNSISSVFYDLAFTIHQGMVDSGNIGKSTLINAFLNLSEDIKDTSYDRKKLIKKIESNIKLFTWVDNQCWDKSTLESIVKIEVYMKEYGIEQELNSLEVLLGELVSSFTHLDTSNTLKEVSSQNTSLEAICETLFLPDDKVEATVIMNYDRKGILQIGRGLNSGNDIIIGEGDKSVSRVHLKVSAYKQGYFIEDVSSMGTYVDNKKIEKNVKKYVTIKNKIRLGQKQSFCDLNHELIQLLRV